MKAAILIALLTSAISGATPVLAGAWTLTRGEAQTISNVTLSRANTSFTDSGLPNAPTNFSKLWSSICAEFGITDRLTGILQADYARDQTGSIATARDRAFAYGGGLRYRLFDRFGVLSVQASFMDAGPFDLSVSDDHSSGKEVEVRALYGTNFRIFKHEGFFDIEAGERWISGPRPSETPIDLTLGFHITAHNCLLIQSFNIIAGDDAKPPYRYYRIHKLALSTVWGPWHGISLQTGGFVSPRGQNSLVETGAFAAIWVHI